MNSSKDKVLIIGTFPNPVHGMSLANESLLNSYLKTDNVLVKHFNITMEKQVKNKNEQGVFTFKNFLFGVVNLTNSFFFLISNRKSFVYIVPPQSVLGFLRLSPTIILAKLLNKRITIHFHGSKFASNINNSSVITRFFIHLTLKCVDKVILLGKSIGESHKDIIQIDKVSICENGIPLPFVVTKKIAKKINVLFLSNLMKDKGVFDFFDMVELDKSNKFSFHIAGAIENEFDELIQFRINELGSRITYHGPAYGEHKKRLFSDANIFVLPSYDEGQPLSILEAYSYGCTVVTTNVGGVKDIFIDGNNGKFCKLASPLSMYTTLCDITENDLCTFSSNNILCSQNHYSETAFFSRVDNVIRGGN
jgi:glycosyltransferase involved in cell wall biosynthesis